MEFSCGNGAVGEAALNVKPRTESRYNAVLELRSVRRTRKRGAHAERKFAAARKPLISANHGAGNAGRNRSFFRMGLLISRLPASSAPPT